MTWLEFPEQCCIAVNTFPALILMRMPAGFTINHQFSFTELCKQGMSLS
jgi:hypothetical protein